ncbi:MAG: RHS repeat-associated core domain-containing protein [Saprospiraceae bacterium]
MDGPWATQYQKDEQGETVLDDEGNPVVDRDKLNRYQYNGKELTEDLGLNWNDYGARWYDAAVGRWNSVDRFAELYSSHSPYNYVLNSPSNAVDPDGNLVIFINGFTPHKNEQGTARYWRSYRRDVVGYGAYDTPIYGQEYLVRAFDTEVMDQLRDHETAYIHGGNNPSRGSRYADGFVSGLANAEAILDKIVDENGFVTETIKIITHSMGAAFGKGFAAALLKIAKRRKVKGVPITLVADFDPFQADRLEAHENVFTQQFWHDGGFFGLADQTQKNASVREDKEQASHSIMTFFNDISNLQEGRYEYNGKEWICTSCN